MNRVEALRDVAKVVVGGEEVPGVIAYGLRAAGSGRSAEFPREVWALAGEPTEFVLRGEAWEIPMWEIPLRTWPATAEFPRAITSTLARLIEAGCRVAWIGAEGLPFCDPPHLFDPGCMSGSVLAWMTEESEGECRIDLTAPIAPVSESILRDLRTYAAGLADAR